MPRVKCLTILPFTCHSVRGTVFEKRPSWMTVKLPTEGVPPPGRSIVTRELITFLALTSMVPLGASILTVGEMPGSKKPEMKTSSSLSNALIVWMLGRKHSKGTIRYRALGVDELRGRKTGLGDNQHLS